MKVVKSDKYIIVGFNSNPDTSNSIPRGWIIRSKEVPNFDSETLIISELKYIDRGRVYFLKKDGTIEEGAREGRAKAFFQY